MPNKEIAIELDISKQTVHHYLEKADALGLLMNYSRQEVEKRKGVLRSEYLINSQPHVTRINDMKEWISSSSCAEELGVDQSAITKACKEHTTVNIFYNGEPAYFIYTEEYGCNYR